MKISSCCSYEISNIFNFNFETRKLEKKQIKIVSYRVEDIGKKYVYIRHIIFERLN